MKNNMSLILLLIITLGCNNTSKVENTMNVEDTIVFKCWIFPSGVSSETYSIQLDDKRNFVVKFGDKEIDIKDFAKVYKSEEKTLDKSDFNRLLKLKKEIKSIKEVERGALRKGGWEIIFKSDSKLYHFYYGTLKDSSLNKIIEAIKEISPIEIDIHGWS